MILPKWVINYSSLLKEYDDEFPNEDFNILYNLESPCWRLFEQNGINYIILCNEKCEDLFDYLLIDIQKLLHDYLPKKIRSAPKNVWYKKYLIGTQLATLDGNFSAIRFNETLKQGHLEWIKWALNNGTIWNEYSWYYALKGGVLKYLIRNTKYRPSSSGMDYLYNFHKEDYDYIMNIYTNKNRIKTIKL